MFTIWQRKAVPYKMLSFLKKCKTLINQPGKMCLVVGNESCDLDSAVSAIALAFFYSKIYPDQYNFLPLLNIPRKSFPIKTEVSYYLANYNIRDEFLLFKDDTTNDFIKQNSVILVDHHVSPYNDSVIEVFDHRPIDNACKLSKSCKTTIEQVGSCATLIADLILRVGGSNNDFCIPLQLLYGAIVMDTVNFSPEAYRTTELDSTIATKVEDFLGVTDPVQHRNKLFLDLVKAREDISSLTAIQLLNKDLKIISNLKGSVRVGFPGFPISAQEFLSKPEAKESIKLFAEENNCSVILLIGMKIISKEEVKRDIGLININNTDLYKQILESIKSHDQPNLQLKEIKQLDFFEGLLFQQENIKATRKQILPIVKNILDKI